MEKRENYDIDELIKLIPSKEIAVLKDIWDCFLQNKEWPKGKVIRRSHGRAFVEQVVSKFKSILIQSQELSGAEQYVLTLEGIYVVEGINGPYFRLVISYLDYLKKRFEEDVNFEKVTASEIGSALNINSSDLRVLGEFLRLSGRIALWSGSAGDLQSSNWNAGVMHDIEILFEATSSEDYLREKMSLAIGISLEVSTGHLEQMKTLKSTTPTVASSIAQLPDKWKIIDRLGEGGQGKVYRVIDLSKFNLNDDIRPSIEDWIKEITSPYKSDQSIKDKFDLFSNAVVKLNQMYDPIHQGALKILHEPLEARDADRAEERIKREMQAMSAIQHPNLLKIVDADADAKWFVSQYYPKGTLDGNRHIFTGNFSKSLKAFRALVEGVSELHKKGIVHRDIKPQNIFIDSEDNLVLGDFGLVFYVDDKHTRLSNTYENVGSRDWMPAWAMGLRIEEIAPSFDVFSLGKVLWSMVSGTPILRLWYFEEPQFNLEALFPTNRLIKFANPLLKRCVVEKEKSCLPTASHLLGEVDKLLTLIETGADIISAKHRMFCKVCGIGSYELTVNNDMYDTRNFGFNPAGSRKMKIFVCNHCGHVQIFTSGDGHEPPAWAK